MGVDAGFAEFVALRKSLLARRPSIRGPLPVTTTTEPPTISAADGRTSASDASQAGYLRTWLGTAVVYTPCGTGRELLRALEHERVLVPSSLVSGTEQARALVPQLHPVTAILPPRSSAAPNARAITASALTRWQLDGLRVVGMPALTHA